MSATRNRLMSPSVRRVRLMAAVLVLTLSAGVQAQAEEVGECFASATAPVFGSNVAEGLHAALDHQEAAAPHTAFHGQLLLGRDTLYLYHLPLFMVNPQAHPHNFQVILEVELNSADGAERTDFTEDRDRHPDVLYSAKPADFNQSALVLDYPGHGPLRALPASVFRGHFERPPNTAIIESATFDISRVVHFREFVAGGQKLEPLSYLLFGRNGEFFMAHLLSAPPDFDQILAVEIENERLSDELLRQGLYVSLPERENDIQGRLRRGDAFSCRFDPGGEAEPIQITGRVTDDLYCEAGEVAQVGFAGSRDCPPRHE